MPEDIRELLALLDRPAPPPAGLAEAVCERLEERFGDLEAIPLAPPEVQLPSPIPIRWRRPRRWVAAVAAALVVVLGAIILLVPRPESALAVIQEAQQRYSELLPFRATFVLRTPGEAIRQDLPSLEETPPGRAVVHEISYQDDTRFRNAVIENSYEKEEPELQVFATPPAGEFWVADGEFVGHYSKTGDVLEASRVADHSADELRFLATGLLDPALHNFGRFDDPFFEERCTVLPDDELLGRPAQRISCADPGQRNYPGGPTLDFDVWLDSETGLVLRVESAQEGVWLEVRSLEVSPSFEEDQFQVVPPPGASVIWAGEGAPPARFQTTVDPEVSAVIEVGNQSHLVTAGDDAVWVAYTEGGKGPTYRGGVDTIARIDPATNTVVATVPLPTRFTKVPRGYAGPLVWATGLVATDEDVWVSEADGDEEIRAVERIDPADNEISRPVISGPYRGLAFGHEAVWVMSSKGGGIPLRYPGGPYHYASVVRVDPDTDEIAAKIPLKGTIAYGGDHAAGEGAVWVAAAQDDLETFLDPGYVGTRWVVFRISPTSNRVAATIRLDRAVSRTDSIAAGEGAVWVRTSPATEGGRGTVLRIDPRTNEVVARIRVGRGWGEVEIGEGSAWVTNAFDNTVLRIDPKTNRVTDRITVGGMPQALAVAHGAVWVANQADGTVARVNVYR